MIRVLIVVSEADPVAPRVAGTWGTPPASGLRVGADVVRTLGPEVGMVRRAALHIHDEALDASLGAVPELGEATVVFPSVHRSESGTECLTVHPLGNPGPEAEVGGRARTLCPTDPRRMADALRRLSEAGGAIGWTATYEATHHGPWLDRPAFFAEIGYGDAPGPSEESVRVLASVLPELVDEPADRVVVGIGGGHYVPHFTELALRRHWAFGHLLSRHAFASTTREVLKESLRMTPGSEGFLFARTVDASDARVLDLAPRRRETEAPLRGRPEGPTPSASSRPSGT